MMAMNKNTLIPVHGHDHRKDPTGLVQRDLLLLKKTFPKQAYNPATPHAKVMYEEGIQAVIRFIEEKMISD